MKPVERVVAATFRQQYGVLHRRQALRLGVSARQITRRLTSGEWERVHPSVYRLASSPGSYEQSLLAACLAAGARAVASHEGAAWMWRMLPERPRRPSITVPPQHHPRLNGVAVHRLNDLDQQRVIVRRGIPCTDPLRTLVDLAAVAESVTTVEALDRTLVSKLTDVQAIDAELERRGGHGRRGVAPLRQILIDRGMTGGPTPSALEAAALQLMRRWGIPVRGREVVTDGGRYRIDFLLTETIAVEVDGYAFHWSPEAKSRDEERRNRLRLRGMTVLVYTWRDIFYDERRVATEIMSAL